MPTRIFLLHFSEYQLQDYLPCILMLSYTIQKLSVFPITCTPSLQRMYTYYKQNFSAFQPFFYNQSDNLVDLFFKYRTSCTTAIIISISSDFITMLSVSLAYSFRLDVYKRQPSVLLKAANKYPLAPLVPIMYQPSGQS